MPNYSENELAGRSRRFAGDRKRQATDTRLRFQIPRSEWFSKVLEPIGPTEYLCTEIAVPRPTATCAKRQTT